MCEVFLLQNKCRVAKVDKKRCLAVDLSNLAITNKCWVGTIKWGDFGLLGDFGHFCITFIDLLIKRKNI